MAVNSEIELFASGRCVKSLETLVLKLVQRLEPCIPNPDILCHPKGVLGTESVGSRPAWNWNRAFLAMQGASQKLEFERSGRPASKISAGIFSGLLNQKRKRRRVVTGPQFPNSLDGIEIGF